MKYVTNNGVLDARNEDTIQHPIFTFNIKSNDYMLNHHITWDIVMTEYTFQVGNHRIQLPAGVYLYCGDDSGMFDWVATDELLGRDFRVFQMACNFRKWKTMPISIMREEETRSFMPHTLDIIPVADSGGEFFMFMSYSDPTRKHKDMDFLNMFVL